MLPEDSIAPADQAEGEEAEDEQPSPAYPAQLTITITKPGNKAIEIRAVAQDGTIEIENLSFFPKESLLEAQSTKDASEARSLYAGPPVDELDPELQQMLQQYLEERGIDEELASFLPEYMEYKEQKEYVKWLEGWCNIRDRRGDNAKPFQQISRTSSRSDFIPLSPRQRLQNLSCLQYY